MLNLPKSREGRTLILFTALFAAATGLLIANVLTDSEAQGQLGGILEVLYGLGRVTLGLVAITFIIVEGSSMLAEMYKRRRFEEGRAEGKAEGKAEKDQEWREWFERNKDKLEDVGALDPIPKKPD